MILFQADVSFIVSLFWVVFFTRALQYCFLIIIVSANVNILFQFGMRRNEEIPAFTYKMNLLFSK